MNKLFIVLLAVCLVSTHAFVKRDAPSDVQSNVDAMTKKLGEIGTDIKEGAAKALDPDTIKKNINGFVESSSKMLSSFKPAAEGEASKAQ